LGKIRSNGGRISNIRRNIIEYLYQKGCLSSQADIVRYLEKNNLNPNRSTLFRELSYLTKHNFVQKNSIANIDYYEIPSNHHHHLVCLKCNSIERIDMCNHLEEHEEEIAMKKGFTVINHSLEFYGHCEKCK